MVPTLGLKVCKSIYFGLFGPPGLVFFTMSARRGTIAHNLARLACFPTHC